MTKEITIHAALGELKKIKQRISRATMNSTFIGNMKQSSENVNQTSLSKDKFITSVEADYQSVTDLIDLADQIKSSVVLSNATTKLLIGEITMTVAEAIEKKTSIQFKKDLLSRMNKQYKDIVSHTNVYNENVETNLDAQVTTLCGKDTSAKANLTGFMDQYRKENSWIIVDPLELKSKINTLEEEIFDFETNVDVALSVSNATTFITI